MNVENLRYSPSGFGASDMIMKNAMNMVEMKRTGLRDLMSLCLGNGGGFSHDMVDVAKV